MELAKGGLHQQRRRFKVSASRPIAAVMKKAITGIVAALLLTGLSWQQPEECQAGQGCCSYHGGQCGCSGSRVKCCDGTLSPSCQC